MPGTKRIIPSEMTLAILALFASYSLPVPMVSAVEYLNGIKWEEPAIVTPGKTDAEPPSDAVVLFGGSDLSKWQNGENWKVEAPRGTQPPGVDFLLFVLLLLFVSQSSP
jgi:hypothetical protein